MKPIKLISSCPNEKRGCVKWVEKYLKDCLCNLNDDISFGLGLVSLVSWGVAEIPQIITNYSNKSGSGVSLAFLSAWIVGDIFNLVGCVLDPATLPTQFYTALLYTITTVILVLQCIYYDHLLRWWNCRNIEVNLVKDESKHLKSDRLDASRAAGNSPVEVPHHRKFYYTSARSMAGSDTPPFKSYIKAKSGPSALEINVDSSSEDETTPAPPKKYSQPQRIPRSVGYGTFLATSANLPFLSRALTEAYLKTSGGRLLQGNEFDEENALGEWLGWLMAAIYMGGRIPQIWLNIKRGSVEGLNPLMFIFALIANATYTGSILVRSTEWEKIKANMPWLLDAIVCVVLDLFIIIQYVYYRYIKIKKIQPNESYYGHGGI